MVNPFLRSKNLPELVDTMRGGFRENYFPMTCKNAQISSLAQSWFRKLGKASEDQEFIVGPMKT